MQFSSTPIGYAFAFIFDTFSKIVSFVFNDNIKVEGVTLGYILIAISILSIVIGSVLSFSTSKSTSTGYSLAHRGIDHMAHTVNRKMKG